MIQPYGRKKNVFFLPLLLIFLSCIACAPTFPTASPQTSSATPSACIQQDWPHRHSDLQPDPSLHFGVLKNGLRYVLKRNQEPKERVALYLAIQAGSLHEHEEERGLAHFLEHMLFNGSTHYPPGALVEYFQSIGMGFGGDTNAHTGFDETVYKLILPKGDAPIVEKGLLVLADYARGALLLEEEVTRERGVILSEKRSRESAAERFRNALLRFQFADTLIAQREPIGLEEALRKADSALLRSYYDRWYRPDNMVVAAVGDMNVEEVEALIYKQLAGLRPAQQSKPLCPEYGRVKESGLEAIFIPEPELGYASISLAAVRNIDPAPDSLAQEAKRLREYMAIVLLNHRLRQLERQAGSPFTEAQTMSGTLVRHFDYAMLGARTNAKGWRQTLAVLQQALDQARAFGFSQTELERGRKEIKAMLHKAVQTGASRNSRELAEEIIRRLGDDEVMLSPQQEQALFTPMLEQITKEEALAALRSLWPDGRRLLALGGDALPNITPQEAQAQIKAAYERNRKREISAWKEPQPAQFPYLPAPVAKNGVAVLERQNYADIGLKTFVLAGGVRLNHKKTDFQPNQAAITVHFGAGKQQAPSQAVAILAQEVVSSSGTGRLNREQLEDALAGSNISLDFKVGPESFSFSGSALSSELETLMQLIHARLVDPGFRPEALTQAKQQLRQHYAQLQHTVEGRRQLEGNRFFAAASPEYAVPTWPELEAVGLAQIKAWLTPLFSTEALEINIIGDVSAEQALGLVSTYLGGAKRVIGPKPKVQAIIFPQGQTKRLQVASSANKAQLTLAWKTDDFWDIERTRRLNVLASVLDDRLRRTIREELGAAYSPQALSLPSRVHPGFGLMQASVIVAPGRTEELAGVIKASAAELAAQGPTEEALQRALQPALTSIREHMKTNDYWLDSVLSLSSRHPEQLRWPLSLEQDFASIKTEEIKQLASQYLQPEQAATLFILPHAK